MAIKESKKDPLKFTSEELELLKTLQQDLNEITFQLGHLQINKIKLEKDEIFLRDKLAELEKKELQTADDLTKKYGKGNLNIDTGEFIPSE